MPLAPPPPIPPKHSSLAPSSQLSEEDALAALEAMRVEMLGDTQATEPKRTSRAGKKVTVGPSFKTPAAPISDDIFLKWPLPACRHGWHEGTRAKVHSGEPARTCVGTLVTPVGYGPKRQTYHCDCKCHKDLDTMYEMAGMERVAVPNPEYIPVKNTFWIPSPEERVAARLAERSPDARVITYDDGISAPELRVEYVIPPDSGRRPKGLLEQVAQQVCNEWMQLGEARLILPCSVKYISARIAALSGDSADDRPSEGALANVLKRWNEIGAAVIGEKPMQFVDWTEEGRKTPLHVLKERNKRSSKSAAASSARHIPSVRRK